MFLVRLAKVRPPKSRLGRGSEAVTLTVAVVGASLLLAFVFYALPSGVGLAIVRENGAIEVPTALAFAAAAVAAIRIAFRDRWPSGYAAAVILAAAAARELDFHRRLTTISVERGFYLGYLFLTPQDAPWPEKLAVGVVLAVLVAAVITLVVREGRAFVAGLRARRPTAVAVLGGVAALVVAQVFDKGSRRLGLALPGLVLLWKAMEENLELASAVLFLLALLIRRRA
jgi:hypothetical protein